MAILQVRHSFLLLEESNVYRVARGICSSRCLRILDKIRHEQSNFLKILNSQKDCPAQSYSTSANSIVGIPLRFWIRLPTRKSHFEPQIRFTIAPHPPIWRSLLPQLSVQWADIPWHEREALGRCCTMMWVIAILSHAWLN